ncbi:MAG: hypothetical protein RLZZ436_4335 [Planctomycetota bacterium]
MPGMLFAAHLPLLALPLMRGNPRSVDFWVLPFCLAVLLVLFLLRRSAGEFRWDRTETLLLLADALFLGLAFAFRDPAWAGLAAACAAGAFAAVHVDRIGNRHLGGLALFVWAGFSVPGEISLSIRQKLTESVIRLASNLAWRSDVSNYREGDVLHSLSQTVDIAEVLWSPAAWTAVFLMTVLWGAAMRRSVIQTLCLLVGMLSVFLLLTSLQAVWLLQQEPGGRLSSPLWSSLCLLPCYLLALLSGDWLILSLTAPMPLVTRQGESAAWDNPFIYFWNTLVAGFYAVPLQKFGKDSFRLPLTAAAICLLLLPMPLLVLVALSAGSTT